MRMAGNERNGEIGGDESVKQRCEGSTDSHHNRQCRRRGKRGKGRCSAAQPDEGQHGNSDRHDEGHDQCEVAKFVDHRKSSLDMICTCANKYHGGLNSQTTRDIPLTLVDGTHSYYCEDAPHPPHLICGMVSQFQAIPCGLGAGASPGIIASEMIISGSDQMMCCLDRPNMS